MSHVLFGADKSTAVVILARESLFELWEDRPHATKGPQCLGTLFPEIDPASAPEVVMKAIMRATTFDVTLSDGALNESPKTWHGQITLPAKQVTVVTGPDVTPETWAMLQAEGYRMADIPQNAMSIILQRVDEEAFFTSPVLLLGGKLQVFKWASQLWPNLADELLLVQYKKAALEVADIVVDAPSGAVKMALNGDVMTCFMLSGGALRVSSNEGKVALILRNDQGKLVTETTWRLIPAPGGGSGIL